MKKIYGASIVMIAMAMIFTISSCNNYLIKPFTINLGPQEIVYKNYNTIFLNEKLSSLDASNLKSYERVSENDILSLYIDRETSYIALVDKRNRKVWYSVSDDIENDINANEDSKPLSKSTLSIYYNDQQTSKFMENYTNSIIQKNFTVENIDNGVRIKYRIENAAITTDDIPHKLSDARFKEIFVDNANLTDVDKVRTKKYFTYNEAGKYWEYIADEEKLVYMAEIMRRVQYNTDDLVRDNDEFNINIVSKRVFFNISIEFTLQNENMIVAIPANLIIYNADCPPLEINVLQNFGATLNENGGYILVPDGSGALIRYSASQSKTGIYKTRIYGQDLTIPVKQNSQSEYHSNFPIFGMKAGDAAFLAIIEDADALSYVNAVRANTLNSYNAAFASFVISESQNVSIGNSNINSLPITQKNIYKGNIRLRYSILSQDDSDYSGMARYYRNYLTHVNNLKSKTGKNYNFNIEILGAIESEKSLFGFSYLGLKSLTTFKQATEIIEEFTSNNVGNINIKYSGWMNDGLNQNSAINFEIVKCIGNRYSFDKFNLFAAQKGIQVFYDINMLTIPQKSKNYWKYTDSAKALDNSLAQVYKHDIVTGMPTGSDYIVSLQYLKRLSKSVVDNSSKLGISSVSLNNLGSDIYSDFGEKNADNRQAALQIHKNTIDELGTEFESIMLNNANSYAIRSGNLVLNAPLSSSNNNIFDETVPFYTMVLHGLVDYAGSPMNFSDNINDAILKSIETGAQPYFCFMYSDGFAIKNTEFNYLYSNDFRLWIETACETYKKLNSCLGKVQNRQLISHTKVQDNLYKIIYEGNCIIYVNYNENSVEIDDLLVNGKDFIMIGGENQ